MQVRNYYRQFQVRKVGDGALTANGTSEIVDLTSIIDSLADPLEAGVDAIGIMLNITAVSGTTPTLTVDLQISEDGSNWETHAISAFNGLSTIGVKSVKLTDKYPSRYLRLNYTVGGTTPSFTFDAWIKVKI